MIDTLINVYSSEVIVLYQKVPTLNDTGINANSSATAAVNHTLECSIYIIF